ncbi:hypothetical protein DWB64_09825 [Fusibacter sp. A1]|nr:hypothetical protein DWB64_09825 [Fusibacter sp. A1]
MNGKLQYIKEYYTSEEEEINLSEYKYLSTEQMDKFILECSEVVINKLMQVILVRKNEQEVV